MKVIDVRRSGTTYTLEINQDEAQLLFDITRMVSGSPLRSRRRIADDIHEALFKAGLKPANTSGLRPDDIDPDSRIHIKETS